MAFHFAVHISYNGDELSSAVKSGKQFPLIGLDERKPTKIDTVTDDLNFVSPQTVSFEHVTNRGRIGDYKFRCALEPPNHRLSPGRIPRRMRQVSLTGNDDRRSRHQGGSNSYQV